MKSLIKLVALCAMITACDTAVSPQIAGAGDNGGVVTGGGSGGSTALKVVPSSIELSVGNKITLTTNSPSTPVSWKSDASTVVSINGDGVATAIAAGVATITATTQSGTVRTATATITVH